VIIGVVGGACCGKDTVADILVDRFGFIKISTSELVRSELLAKGLDGTRENQLKFANQRRKKHGGSYFLREALSLAMQNHQLCDLVISDLYCVAEATHLRKIGGRIIAVECSDIEKRFQRLKARHSGRRDEMTFDEFSERVNAENSGTNDSEPNVKMVLQLSDFEIANEFDQDALIEQTEQAIAQFKKESQDISHGLDRFPSILRPPSNSSRNINTHENNLDSHESLIQLERRHRAIQFITQIHLLTALEPRSRALAPLYQPTHAVHQINNQFAETLIATYLEPDPPKALIKYKSLEAHTTDEELALLLNDTEFLNIHSQLEHHLTKIDGEIHESVVEAQHNIAFNDREQFRGTESRSLTRCLEDGFEIRVQPDAVERIMLAQSVASNGPIPILELIKNERIIESGGLSNSKISLAVHDLMDHIWLCSLLINKGTHDRHRNLFDAVGNPEYTNLFKREGEMFASIAFGVRHWANIGVGFMPLHSVTDILQRFDSLFDDDELKDYYLDSYRILRRLAHHPQSRTAQCLGFTFSNYLVELNEQRRRNGTIKERDPQTHKVIGELDPWGAKFLSFFVDTVELLLDSQTKHRDTLLRIHILLEEFFASSASTQSQPMKIYVANLDKIDFTQTSLPPDRLVWMSTNYGFTALRDAVI